MSDSRNAGFPRGIDDEGSVVSGAPSRQLTAVQKVGIAGLVPHGAASAELGYWLGRPHWGHGFATEAARAILAFAFTTAALPELTSGCFTGNLRSARVLEKLGFRQTGTSTRACLAQAKDLPHLDMRLPRTAWTPLSQGG